MLTGSDRAFEADPGRNAERKLTLAAKRALAEAAVRRSAALNSSSPTLPEVRGRGGLEPVRYGDWEIKGLTSDF